MEPTGGQSVRTMRSLEDDEGRPVGEGELGMVIGYRGELVIVTFTDGRIATLRGNDLRVVVPPPSSRKPR